MGHSLDACINSDANSLAYCFLLNRSAIPIVQKVCAGILRPRQCTMRVCVTMAGIGYEVVALFLDKEASNSN